MEETCWIKLLHLCHSLSSWKLNGTAPHRALHVPALWYKEAVLALLLQCGLGRRRLLWDGRDAGVAHLCDVTQHIMWMGFACGYGIASAGSWLLCQVRQRVLCVAHLVRIVLHSQGQKENKPGEFFLLFLIPCSVSNWFVFIYQKTAGICPSRLFMLLAACSSGWREHKWWQCPGFC